MGDVVCNVCGETRGADYEQANVHSNVRRFKSEEFAVWRCPSCASIHARDEVDLDHYYAGYPFHGDVEIDWRLRLMYGVLLRRLTAFGFSRGQSVLDYGCGGGLFVKYLHDRGIERATGFDEYSPDFNRPELLERRYDAVLCQDVVEHVPDPLALLRRFDSLVEPGGLVAVGTPNASAIDLSRAEKFHHTLHQPYHRHILSERALLDAGNTLGWKLERYFPWMYVNTLVPFVNHRFITRYFWCFDDTLDVGFDPPSIKSWKLFLPLTGFWALFGWFFKPRTDVMAVFRRPQSIGSRFADDGPDDQN